MQPFQAMLAADHLAELRREAAARRLAREADLDNPDRGSGSDPRRRLAQIAIRLSRAAAAAAERLDPALDQPLAGRRASRAPGC
jgi:hypothetical protein